jgi:hypothetical protein
VAIPLFYRSHLGSAHLEGEGGQVSAGSELERHALPESRDGQATEEEHSWCKNYSGKAEMTGTAG